MSTRILALLGAAALALGVAACGGSSASSSSAGSSRSTSSSATSAAAGSTPSAATGGASHLTIAANPSGMLMFTKSSLTAKAGTVTIAFTNQASLGHNFTVAGASGKTMGATPTFSGATKSLTLKLKPGKYTFYCSVPGHRQAGMQGTLTVS